MVAALRFMRSLHAPIYAHRQAVLVKLIGVHLMPDAQVLDVGCGFGHLGRAIMDYLPTAKVQGLERAKRDGELIPVQAYDGTRMPWADNTFDVVILADVLHHELHPDHLLRESVRISRKLIIVKDHLREGLLAWPRICLLDWAANVPYGVPCTYRYNNLSEWRSTFKPLPVELKEEHQSIDIYPPVVNVLLGKGLHYFAVLEKSQNLMNGRKATT
jgi:SAM-dependent methyltransferase